MNLSSAGRRHNIALLLLGLGGPCLAQTDPAPVPRAEGQDGAFVRLPRSTLAQTGAPAERRPCPGGVPTGSTCLTGTDHLGAGYWLAMPAEWNGTLVVHAHGGPDLGTPTLARSEADLKRWSVFLRAGYAWAGSTYRQGGLEVRAAGEDSERARQTFVREFGHPQRTLLHGQSWGASVAARMAERYTTPDPTERAGAGRRPYDAVLLTSGVLAGAPRSYEMRLDLRVVYQAVCGNHPRPDETAYPVWMGLPVTAALDPRRGDGPTTAVLAGPGAPASLSRDELAARLDACTGLNLPEARRSAEQRQRLATLTGVLRLPESALRGHLEWATWHFHDIVWRKLRGRNPFGNEGVKYTGSPGGAREDEALNQRVARHAADPAAIAELGADADPTGRIDLPVLTVHGIDDAEAFVELEHEWRQIMTNAGRASALVQTYTRDRDHQYLSDAAYLAAAEAVLTWSRDGKAPVAADVARRCLALPARWEPAKGCRFVPDYEPAPLERRVPLRKRSDVSDVPQRPEPVRAPDPAASTPAS